MKNGNVWFILFILLIVLCPFAYKNYKQSKLFFDEDTALSDYAYDNDITDNKNTIKSITSEETKNNIESKTTTEAITINTKNVSETIVKENSSKKTINDAIYINFAIEKMYDSGDFDASTGTKIENRRRVRYKDNINIRTNIYYSNIINNVQLNIFEFDANNKFIKKVSLKGKDIYKPSLNAKYFKVSLNKIDGEKSMSPGQWTKFIQTTKDIYLYNGDIDKLTSYHGNLYNANGSFTSASTLVNMVTSGNKNLAAKLFQNQGLTGDYTLNSSELTGRLTMFFSSTGNDNNSGLSPLYPKKNVTKFLGTANMNILFKAGDTFYLNGFSIGSNSLYATYGEGPRAKINYYRTLNVKFQKVSGYDNIWVADLSAYSNGKKDKSNCNFGQLIINGEVNWKRLVPSSGEEFDPNILVRYNNNGWGVDFKNSKLYILTKSNPNNFKISYAPSGHGITINGQSNVTVKGLEIVGTGSHAINITNSSNIRILNNYIHDIGGSILTSAGIRYGNAIQVWNSGNNINVEYNVVDWIFDTCFTNQGSDKKAIQKNIKFSKNIGMHSFWGIEIWGDGWSNKSFSNIEYSSNIIYFAMDITAPDTTMYTAPSGKLLHSGEYVSYRGGYQYHQMSNLEMNNSGTGEVTKVKNNVFAETNRFLVYLNNSRGEKVFSNLENNTFYNRTKNAVFRVAKTYTVEMSSIISSSNKNVNPTSHMTTLMNTISGK